jgi:hypothetical protein
LRVNYGVTRQGRPERERVLDSERKELLASLEKTAEAYAAIDIAEIGAIERERASNPPSLAATPR